MENIKYSLFDLFAYIVPGAIELIMLFSFHQPSMCISVFNALTEMVMNANVYWAALFIVVSYFAGYVSAQISAWYMKIFKRSRYFRPASPAKSTLTNSAKYVLVRELSKENMKYIEIWNVMKTLSSNFSLIALIFSIVFFISYHHVLGILELIFCVLSGLAISIILAKGSCKYEEWRAIDLDNCIDKFKLDSGPDAFLKEIKKNHDS